MRSCFFLVADKDISEMLKGFFSRPQFHLSLGCSAFPFDPEQDMIVAHGQCDPGLYVKGNEYLKGYIRTHEHAVVILDSAWDGSPGKASIEQRMREHIMNAGWMSDDGRAIVIDPELESWIWNDNPHICPVLGYKGQFSELRAELIQKQFWRAGEVKPYKPKEAVEWILRRAKKPKSSALYGALAAKMSVRNCSDAAFQELRKALQTWFP